MDDEKAREVFAGCQKDAAEARLRGGAEVAVFLRQALNHANNSDLEFICKDKVKVKAHRMLLKGRFPKLDALLEDRMLGTNSSIVSLPEVDTYEHGPFSTDLHRGAVFPAMTLQDEGRIRLEVVSGFEAF